MASDYEREVGKITIKTYGSWLLGASVPILSFFPVTFYGVVSTFNSVNEYVQTPYLGELAGAASSLVIATATMFLLHDFACPSSIRKYLKYKEKGDERMARIINWAGFDPLEEFRKVKQVYEIEG